MSGDPRVQAVAEALAHQPFYCNGLCNTRRMAAAAVAALDALDRETAPVSRDHKWLDFHHTAWEADLRERIAEAIEAVAATVKRGSTGWMQLGVAYAEAARIARGTDPGKDTP